MSTVNTGWLKDNSGEKFAPKTLASQIVTDNGKTLDVMVADVKSNINSLSESVVYMDEYDDSIDVNTAAVNTGTTTGSSGIYIGSGDMPEGYNVQIDPEGSPSELVTKGEFDDKTTWKVAGYVNGLDESIDIPSGASELIISCFASPSDTTPIIYQNYALVEQFSTSPERLFLPGYSISSSDYGYAIVEATNTKITLKSFKYNGASHNAYMRIRYR